MCVSQGQPSLSEETCQPAVLSLWCIDACDQGSDKSLMTVYWNPLPHILWLISETRKVPTSQWLDMTHLFLTLTPLKTGHGTFQKMI